MKKLLFAGIAVSMLAACSNDEVVPVNNDANAIKFGVTAEGNTRAADIFCPNNKFGEFNVFATLGGDQYIAADLIKNTGTSTENWENMTGTRYWPNSGKVTFIGYVNADNTFNKETTTAPTFKNFTPKPTVADQLDLMYACEVQAKGEKAGDKVDLNFRHALSQIVFNARNDDANLYVEISNVSVVNVKGQGTYELPTTSTSGNLNHDYSGDYVESVRGKWNFGEGDNAVASTSSYNVDVLSSKDKTVAVVAGKLDADGKKTKGDVVNLTNWSSHKNGGTVEGVAADKTKAMLLIPQETDKYVASTGTTGSYFLVNCKIWNVANPAEGYKDGDICLWEKGNIMIPADFTWEEGKKYLYTFVFGNGNGGYDPENPVNPVLVPITFDVTVDEFFEVNGGEHETGVPANN